MRIRQGLQSESQWPTGILQGLFANLAHFDLGQDGYTDMRGRFDYASLTTPEQLNSTARFALLVSSETDGAVTTEAKPPHGL